MLMSPNYNFICECGDKQIRNFPFGKKPEKIRCDCGKMAEYVIKFPGVLFKGPGFSVSPPEYDPDNAHPDVMESYERGEDGRVTLSVENLETQHQHDEMVKNQRESLKRGRKDWISPVEP